MKKFIVTGLLVAASGIAMAAGPQGSGPSHTLNAVSVPPSSRKLIGLPLHPTSLGIWGLRHCLLRLTLRKCALPRRSRPPC